jgi:predicted lipoprotein with Yx(FWY)xxD motif
MVEGRIPKRRPRSAGTALRRLTFSTALLMLAACASPTMAPSGPGTTRDTPVGRVLTDADGMTLYTYDPDTNGHSNCTGMCAVVWPPVMATDGAEPRGDFSLIRRDGERQWAWKGRPLYTYLFDDKPGEASGDGEDGVWHVAKP